MKKSYLFLAISVIILILVESQYLMKDKMGSDAQQIVSTDVTDDKYDVVETADDISQREYEKQLAADAKEKELIEDTIEGLNLYAYYYDNLSPDLQTVYGEVYYSIVNRLEVTVSTMDKDIVDKAFHAVMSDHPEIFYVSGYQTISHSVNDKLVSISIKAVYVYEADEVEELSAKAETAAGEILKPVSMDWSDYDKIKYVYEYIIENTQYESAQDNQNILSVLLYGKSVCNGYAKAAQYLLNKLDVPCTIVTGDVPSGLHAWNLVEADGHYYYMDVTWGDTDYSSSVNDESVDSKVMKVDYTYFLVDYDTISYAHDAWDVVELPHCTSNMDNYFIHEDLYVAVMNQTHLQTIFNRASAQNKDYVQFRCANKTVYDEVYTYLIDEQGVFDFASIKDQISYYCNEDLCIFYFWFD